MNLKPSHFILACDAQPLVIRRGAVGQQAHSAFNDFDFPFGLLATDYDGGQAQLLRFCGEQK
jgi:hypothetical protein